jgi:hypothetical protein
VFAQPATVADLAMMVPSVKNREFAEKNDATWFLGC